ncbi:MAG: alpha/beta fold hydrolase [Acidimicrobiales bacterium]
MSAIQHTRLHGHDIAYRDLGDPDGEVLVLIHGMAGSSTTWREVLEPLAQRFRVIAPDLLGHGRSAKPAGGDYTLGAHASLVRDLLAHVGVEHATIVGQSLGGGVAMQFAYQYPELCERLVLVNSGGLGRDVSLILRLLSLPGAELLLPVLAPSFIRDTGNNISRWLHRNRVRPPRSPRCGPPTPRWPRARTATPSCAPCARSSTRAVRRSAPATGSTSPPPCPR